MSLFGDILGIGGGAALVNSAYQNLGGIGDTINERMFTNPDAFVNQAKTMTNFTPYGVTSNLGSFSANNGQLNLTGTPDQNALSNSLGQSALNAQQNYQTPGFYGQNNTALQNAFNSAAQGYGQSNEQSIYDRIRAMQSPEEQRQQANMESRLFNQGRMGIRSGAYGGTPEQMAMEKARAEAMNTAAYQAMNQSMQNQNSYANQMGVFNNLQQGNAMGQQQHAMGNQGLIGAMQQNQYMPQSQLMNLAQLGLSAGGQNLSSQGYNAGLWGQMVSGGLEGMLGSRLGQANLVGQLGSGMVSGALGSLAGRNDGLFGIPWL